jgi:hypothetical protein
VKVGVRLSNDYPGVEGIRSLSGPAKHPQCSALSNEFEQFNISFANGRQQAETLVERRTHADYRGDLCCFALNTYFTEGLSSAFRSPVAY